MSVNEYFEDAHVCKLHGNMLDRFMFSKPVNIGINLPNWIDVFHEFKRQHIKCVRVYNNRKTGFVHFTGVNPAAKFALKTKVQNIAMDPIVRLRSYTA